MRKRSGRIAVAGVLFVLGFLVVVQLRSQAADQGLNGLSVQELTELVANLTTRNNQLRQEVQALDLQHDQLAAAVERGDTSAVQVRADLNRLLGWSGTAGVTGAGVRVSVAGPLPGDALDQLLNELRNAGAEAIAINDQRLTVLTSIRNRGPAVRVNSQPVNPPYVVQAIGDVNTLQANLLDTTHGAEFFDLAEDFGVRVERHNEDELTLPGASLPRLRYVRAGTSETSGKEGNE